MYKYNTTNQKGQEGVFTSFEIKRKFNIDFLTASLYGQIKYWATNKEGYCFASNEQFADIFDVSQTQIKRMISNLIEVGLITRIMESNYKRKLFIVEMNEAAHTDLPLDHTDLPLDHTGLPLDHTGLHKIESKLEIKLENKLESNNINYNMENLDLVEEVKGVASNISTNHPEGEDLIPGNDDGNDIDFLIKPEIQLTIEEKLEASKIKSSIKEEEFDIPQKNIEDVFSDYEIANALNY